MLWTASPLPASDGTLHRGRLVGPGGFEAPCALGKTGVIDAPDKREGDGKSPLGRYPIRYGFYRADRLERPETDLALTQLYPDDGWCDAPDHPKYNTFVHHPFDASAERLWRKDGAYDIIIILGHNDAPVVPGLGSAIFLHCAKPGFTPTEGCVALDRDDLIAALKNMRAGDMLEIASPSA